MLKNAEAERRRKEEAEHRAKLDEIAEKQRQRERELEEKERLRREALLGRSTEPLRPSELPGSARPLEPGAAAPAVTTAAAPAAAPAAGRYVPRHRRERIESAGQAPPSEPDRRGGSRPDPSDRWTSGGGSKSTWSSSRRSER